MLRKSSCYFVIVVACMGLLAHFATAGDGSQDQDLHIDEFGISRGKPIKTGYLFWEGRYVDVPYVVSRRGLAIFINDIQIRGPANWPPPEHEKISGEINPEVPDISRMASHYKSEKMNRYIWLKRHYIWKHYEGQEAEDRYAAALKALPCVKDSRRDGDHIELLLYNGEELPLGLVHPPHRPKPPTKKEMLNRWEGARESYERRLKAGCKFWSRGHGMSVRPSLSMLRKLVAITSSSLHEATKFELVNRECGLGVGPDEFPEIVRNFQATPQLLERIDYHEHEVDIPELEGHRGDPLEGYEPPAEENTSGTSAQPDESDRDQKETSGDAVPETDGAEKEGASWSPWIFGGAAGVLLVAVAALILWRGSIFARTSR